MENNKSFQETGSESSYQKDPDPEKQLEILSFEIKDLEKEILPQIEGLASKIPEIYQRYAEIVHIFADLTTCLFNLNVDASRRLSNYALLTEKTIKAYGKYKEIKKRNQLIDKMMTIKHTYALNNIEKIKYLIPKVENKLKTSSILFKKFHETEYNQNELTQDKIERVGLLQLKVLNTYRTTLYYLVLCRYLEVEYSTWLKNSQSSGKIMPDYYEINQQIFKSLTPKNPLEAYILAADTTQKISGAQIMMLLDTQLGMLALGDDLCRININLASPVVKYLIQESAVEQVYNAIVEPLAIKTKSSPETFSIVSGIIAILGVVAMCIWLFPGGAGMRWLIGLIGCISCLRILWKGAKSIQITHVIQTDELIQDIKSKLDLAAGKIEQEDFDYKKKNPFLEAAAQFIQ